MDRWGKRTHDWNEDIYYARKTTHQYYEWLRPRPRGWYYISSVTSA